MLSSQHIVTRRSIMQKVRRQPFIPEGMHRPSTACKFMISGSISLPSRGSFQHSLTVLFSFGQTRVFRLIPWSGQIPAGFPVPRSTWDTSKVRLNFAYRTVTFFGASFQALLLFSLNPMLRSRNPNYRNNWFSLFPFRSPLLGESLTVSVPVVT